MPIGGILLAHYVILRRLVIVEDLYRRTGGFSVAGALAWAAGAAVFYFAAPIGGTLPSLATAVGLYVIAARKP